MLAPCPLPMVYHNTFKYKPSQKTSGNPNRCREGICSRRWLWWQGLAGRRQDAPGWCSTGKIPGLWPESPHTGFQRSQPQRHCHTVNMTPPNPTDPFPGPSPSTQWSPLPEGPASLLSTKAAHSPLLTWEVKTSEPPCWSPGCFWAGDKSRKTAKHGRGKWAINLLHFGVINSSRSNFVQILQSLRWQTSRERRS